MDNNWFVSRPPLNKKHFINDAHDGLWIFTETVVCPVSHVKLCYPSHVFILVGEKVAFLYTRNQIEENSSLPYDQ